MIGTHWIIYCVLFVMQNDTLLLNLMPFLKKFASFVDFNIEEEKLSHRNAIKVPHNLIMCSNTFLRTNFYFEKILIYLNLLHCIYYCILKRHHFFGLIRTIVLNAQIGHFWITFIFQNKSLFLVHESICFSCLISDFMCLCWEKKFETNFKYPLNWCVCLFIFVCKWSIYVELHDILWRYLGDSCRFKM